MLTVDGTRHEVDVDGDTPLLRVIRETIGLTGTKCSYGVAQCVPSLSSRSTSSSLAKRW